LEYYHLSSVSKKELCLVVSLAITQVGLFIGYRDGMVFGKDIGIIIASVA
jgi:hypothetical protein